MSNVLVYIRSVSYGLYDAEILRGFPGFLISRIFPYCPDLRIIHTRCLSVGKTDISQPICESTWIAVIGFLLNPGTVLIRFKEASYLSLRQRISRSTSEMCLFSSSMWSRHCLSLTACSLEMAPSTAACISSIGVLQRPWTKGATSNVSPGCCKICSVMEREDLPNTSEKTSSSFKLDTVDNFGHDSFHR